MKELAVLLAHGCPGNASRSKQELPKSAVSPNASMVSGVAAATSTRTPEKEAMNARMETRIFTGAMPDSSKTAVGVYNEAIASGSRCTGIL